MADKKEKSSFAFLNTIFVFGLIIGLVIWLALIATSQGEQRLEQSCKPIEYSTQFLHELTTSIIGRQPTWTLYVQRYLMTGCYYTFTVIFSAGNGQTVGGGIGEGEPTSGGINP